MQSLFMGLVRLVKKTALEESEEKYRAQINQANENLRKAILALNNKERDYNQLKTELDQTKLKNSTLVDSILKLRCDKANKLRIKTVFVMKENGIEMDEDEIIEKGISFDKTDIEKNLTLF